MKESVYFNSTHRKEFQIQRNRFASTALIPKVQWLRVIPRLRKRSFANYIHELISEYRLLLLSQGHLNPSMLRTKYQPKEQNLIRCSYRPIERSYQELRMIGSTLGVSQSYLISLLIHWDLSKIKRKIFRSFWNSTRLSSPKRMLIWKSIDYQRDKIGLFCIFDPKLFSHSKHGPV
ncbi:DUF1564 family protein [Leptospira perolatii]|uniref:DUF1564 family protein n=1 Tax=Leptospira perolatii TaxID=2023191 RepID=UPI0013FD969D